MINFEDLGVPRTHQKITPGNTITSFTSDCYKYRRWKLNFTDADSEIVIGDWITGATSGAIGKVVEITSTAWTDGVGNLILDSWNGVAFQDAEELKVAAGATMANVSGLLVNIESTGYDFKGAPAKSALVVVYAQTALVSLTIGKPDQTALIGLPMVANSSMLLRNYEAIRNFKCVDYTAQSASIIQATFSF